MSGRGVFPVRKANDDDNRIGELDMLPFVFLQEVVLYHQVCRRF